MSSDRSATPVHQPAMRRRRVLAGGAALTIAAAIPGCATPPKPGPSIKVGGLFAGRINDRGFMEAGWRGLERARTELGVTTTLIEGIEPRKEQLATAIAQLADSGVDLVVAHGGQNNEACAEVSARYPQIRFVVTQGAVVAPNLASYEVLQEESAYLAGVLAASVTRTGVIGHMSGIRVRPGLKGRAAYAAGARDTNPSVRLLTNFSGNQDDNALSKRVALAQIAAGADVIFTMLNAGRQGAIEACREKGVRQIGNVVDWVKADPVVFVGSATADVGLAVFEAVKDTQAGAFPGGTIRRIGLSTPGAVSLTLANDVPPAAATRVAKSAGEIMSHRLVVPDTYDGPEFTTPA